MTAERRFSAKRNAIREALCNSREHPSAEALYAGLKPRFPDLSLGTIYRNLTQMREDGEIQRVATVNGQDRFDADTSPHGHFVCEHCGAVLDVEAPLPDILQAMPLPGSVHSFSLTFQGVCRRCC